MRTIRQLLQELSTTPDRGLLTPEAVGESVRRFGANRLTPLPREPLWKKFLEKFDEPIIKILLAAALLSMFVEVFRGEPEKTPPTPGAPLLAGIMLGILVAAVLVFYVVRLGQWIPSLLFGS